MSVQRPAQAAALPALNEPQRSTMSTRDRLSGDSGPSPAPAAPAAAADAGIAADAGTRPGLWLDQSVFVIFTFLQVGA